MDGKRVARYFTAADVMNDAYMREAAIYFEHKVDPNTALPTDVSVEGMAQIYAIRLAAGFKTTGAMICRLTGVDALTRLAVDKEFPV